VSRELEPAVEEPEEPAERQLPESREAILPRLRAGGSISAHSAGLSVSELKAEMMVAIAIVMANCR
jgi:hypothetical protein